MSLSSLQGPTPSSVRSRIWPPTRPWPGWNNAAAVDRWCTDLDGRCFTAGETQWTIQVVGVQIDEAHIWIQMRFAEHPESSLLLQLTSRAGLQDAIDVVRAEVMWRTASGSADRDVLAHLGTCRDVIIRMNVES